MVMDGCVAKAHFLLTPTSRTGAEKRFNGSSITHQHTQWAWACPGMALSCVVLLRQYMYTQIRGLTGPILVQGKCFPLPLQPPSPQQRADTLVKLFTLWSFHLPIIPHSLIYRSRSRTFRYKSNTFIMYYLRISLSEYYHIFHPTQNLTVYKYIPCILFYIYSGSLVYRFIDP